MNSIARSNSASGGKIMILHILNTIERILTLDHNRNVNIKYWIEYDVIQKKSGRHRLCTQENYTLHYSLYIFSRI